MIASCWKVFCCAMLPVVLFSGCEAAGDSRPVQGNTVPAYQAETLDGDTLSLTGLRGEVVLLNIWATWCPPCREEMPSLEALHQDLADEGLRVVAVSVDARAAAPEVRQFVENHGISFTILHDPAEQVSRTFRTIGVPESFLIDRDGTIVEHWIGKIDAASDEVRRPVREALESSG